MENKNGMLYPLMILAAISVIIFSVVGIATMTGQVPNALSFAQRVEPVAPRQAKAPTVPGARPAAASSNRPAHSRDVVAAADCSSCGVIESIREVEVNGQGTGAGMAVGGAYVGNEVAKNQRPQSAYRVTVRMEDGTYRIVTQRSHPGYAVGERVKVVNGAVVARG